MFENIIKGGIKPGMVLISDHATRLGSKETWIVFPNNYGKMHAVRFSGNYWDSLRQEGDLLYVGGYQIRRIYDSPRGALVANEALIWSKEGGVIKPEYKPASSLDDSLGDLLTNLGDKSSPIGDDKNSEESPTQYFY